MLEWFKSKQSGASQSTAPAGSSRTNWIDPASVLRIRNLELRAKMVVEGFLSGLHRSPYHGFSVEFSEYREYSPGDDPRYLDWRLYARSDRYYVKRFEDETNVRVMVLVDMSHSMGFGSLGYHKRDYARTAAATMAMFLLRQRDAVGVLTFDEMLGEYIPPRFRPGHLHRVLVALERELAGRSTDLTKPLDQVANTVKKRCVVLVISDLLAPVPAVEERLGFLRASGHEVIVWRVLDPAEVRFEFEHPSLFVDVESGKRLYIDPHTARKKYLDRFQEHQQQLTEACRRLGIDFESFVTDQPLEFMLFHYLSARLHRGKSPAGRSVAGGIPV